MTALRKIEVEIGAARPGRAADAAKYARAKRRVHAYCRVLDAVAEQRDALAYRAWLADPDDTFLPADVQTWCELSLALADLPARKRGTKDLMAHAARQMALANAREAEWE